IARLGCPTSRPLCETWEGAVIPLSVARVSVADFCYALPAKMRGVAIFGLGSSLRDLQPFKRNCPTEWAIGLPDPAGGLSAILVFGGDGTIHRHLGRLVALGLPVLVVPAGSGNDFARAFGIRNVCDSLQAWRIFAAGRGKVRAIDLGLITPL